MDKKTAKLIAAVLTLHVTSRLAFYRELGIRQAAAWRARRLASDINFLLKGEESPVTAEDVARHDLAHGLTHDALISSFAFWGIDEETTKIAVEGLAIKRDIMASLHDDSLDDEGWCCNSVCPECDGSGWE